MKQLYLSHESLLKTFMISRIRRDDDAVINEVLQSLELTNKIFVRIIYLGSIHRCLSPLIFGNETGIGVYLAFDQDKKHFFLAKPHPVSMVVMPSVIPSCVIAGSSGHIDANATTPPTPPPRLRLEDFDFGTPPDRDYSLSEHDFLADNQLVLPDNFDEPYFQ